MEQIEGHRSTQSLLTFLSTSIKLCKMGSSKFRQVQAKLWRKKGVIRSPKLFNLFINALILKLNSIHTVCTVDNQVINNISYTKDMVLLSPSMSDNSPMRVNSVIVTFFRIKSTRIDEGSER